MVMCLCPQVTMMHRIDLACRIENRTSRIKLKYRQVGLDADAWRIVRPHSSAIFAWENLQGEKLLEVIQEGRDVSQSLKIDLDKLGDCPTIPGDNSGFSNICIRVRISSPVTHLLKCTGQYMNRSLTLLVSKFTDVS